MAAYVTFFAFFEASWDRRVYLVADAGPADERYVAVRRQPRSTYHRSLP
jgi:hypothetical protein